jgi:hypothetical protein
LAEDRVTDWDELERNIDANMLDLRDEMFKIPSGESWTYDAIAAFLRAAYGKGYCDALKDKGQFMISNGYSPETFKKVRRG